ncbi:MAG: hypothetical protein Q8P30_02290 [Candidatus Uhrbacteria bacterium]|nr:hypothetical protein [Candidatus Uhrbacteria bacterium]
MPQDKDVQENKVIAAVGYIFVLCFIPLMFAKESKFAQFHAKQGLVLFIAELGVMIVNMVLMAIPILGWLAALALNVFLLLLAVGGILKALAGESWEMPILGKYAKNLKI